MKNKKIKPESPITREDLVKNLTDGEIFILGLETLGWAGGTIHQVCSALGRLAGLSPTWNPSGPHEGARYALCLIYGV